MEMNKIEASLIKSLLRIIGQDLVCSVLDLSHYSLFLVLLDTQSFLGALWHQSKKGKEGKRKQRSSRERQDQVATIGFIVGINLHVHFPYQIWHAWDYMCSIYTMAWVLLGVIVFSAQPCHFLIALMRWVLPFSLCGMVGLELMPNSESGKKDRDYLGFLECCETFDACWLYQFSRGCRDCYMK